MKSMYIVLIKVSNVLQDFWLEADYRTCRVRHSGHSRYFFIFWL